MFTLNSQYKCEVQVDKNDKRFFRTLTLDHVNVVSKAVIERDDKNKKLGYGRHMDILEKSLVEKTLLDVSYLQSLTTRSYSARTREDSQACSMISRV